MNPRFSSSQSRSNTVRSPLNPHGARSDERVWGEKFRNEKFGSEKAGSEKSGQHGSLSKPYTAIAQYLNQQDAGQVDPLTLKAAQAIYQRYRSIENRPMPKALGVAIDPVTHRGQVVLTDCPVLLPQERFISIQMLQAGHPPS